MELKYLQTLLAVVNHHSFAKAGDAVGLSRSAVSLQIGALEKQFGIRLFDRQTRPPTLTGEGRRFVEQARQLLEVWKTMEGGEAATGGTGLLSIGAVQTVVAGILPYALARFQKRCPQIQIRLIAGLAQELDATLRRGGLDAAVLPQSDSIHPGLIWQPFCQEELVVVASRRLPGDTDAALLAAAPYIRFRRVAWGLGRMVDQELVRRSIVVDAQVEVDTVEGILSLVANGLGVAILPKRRMPAPFPREIRTVPFGEPPLTRTLGVLQREDNPRRDFVHQLYETLIEAAGTFDGATSKAGAKPA